jgi:aspartyl-tRNA synthetase
MSTKEELVAEIAKKGDAIRAVKAEKPATLKEDLAPLIADLLKLKISYKEVTGEDFDPPKPPPKEKKAKPAAEPQPPKDGPSKNELKKAAKEKAKAELAAKKAADNAAKMAAQKAAAGPVDEGDTTLYGDLPLINSSVMTDRQFVEVGDLAPELAGSAVWVRGRVASSRAVGQGCFLVLRKGLFTVQAVMFKGGSISKGMIKYATGISAESIVDICAEVTIPDQPVLSCSQKGLELQIKEVHVMNRAQDLPFSLDDAARSEQNAAETGMPVVLQDSLLNYRWVDLRTPANQAIFRIQSGVCTLFREFLLKKNFVEIHTPKLIGGASEGGANVFELQYFGQPACLAQSPQLYKQMAAACSGLDRVFEIGPVFRAENSNTHRHLCEFTGLDFEMAITEHYFEALEVGVCCYCCCCWFCCCRCCFSGFISCTYIPHIVSHLLSFFSLDSTQTGDGRSLLLYL